MDYSQKRLLSKAFYRSAHRKGSEGQARAILFPMAKKKGWRSNLEVYAFWTGLMSTFISLAQVILLAVKK